MMNETLTDAANTNKIKDPVGVMFKHPVHVHQPKPAKSPLIFAFPHSGRDYSSYFLHQSALELSDLRRSEDAFVDLLFPITALPQASFITAKFSRAWVDVNRHPQDLDPEMFDGKISTHNHPPSKQVLAGFGVIPKQVASGFAIYSRKLAATEIQQRLENTHTPYHQAIEQAIVNVRSVFGFAILIDCHSMPGSCVAHTPGGTANIVLGDRYGTSCDPNITENIQELFCELNLPIANNQPYAGGYSLLRHARPMDNVHAIQIEISRSLYMDEDALTQNANFDGLRTKLVKLMKQLDLYAKTYPTGV